MIIMFLDQHIRMISDFRRKFKRRWIPDQNNFHFLIHKIASMSRIHKFNFLHLRFKENVSNYRVPPVYPSHLHH